MSCLLLPTVYGQDTAAEDTSTSESVIDREEDTRIPTITFKRVENAGVKVDGILDEAVWETLTAYDDLRVVSPDSLEQPAYETQWKFFYSNDGLHVSVMSEQPKETLVARLSSRDSFITRDFVSFSLDTSGEGLYGYWFGVNLGGSVSDGTVLPERQFLNQWDGPWHGAVKELDNGYSTEFFLPWSMMMLPQIEGDTRKLGLYMSRTVAHKRERWSWPALPFSRSQFLSVMQDVEIENIKPKKQFTFYPYASASYDEIAGEDDYKAGFDIYWRPSSNLQLTSTINPDFGNVESDNVVVNLTSFETFFPEKRPFFLEGQDIFQTTPRARNRGTPTILVHTRRIGGPPESINNDNLDITSLEANQPTELEAAAKVTGQVGNWRYGVLAAVEDDTKIEGTINDIDVDFEQAGREFGTARLLYETTDLGSRAGFGWITTLVDHPGRKATVHGIDGHFLSSSGKWNIDGQLLYSDVADVAGSGAFLDIEYIPRQGVQHKLGFDYFDEDLEINDFGFLRRNDAKTVRYRFQHTTSKSEKYKTLETTFLTGVEKNHAGLKVRNGIFLNQRYQFNNNSFLFAELNHFLPVWDDLNSNGNGSFRVDSRWQAGAFWETDSSKKFQLGLGYFYTDEQVDGGQNLFKSEFVWRPNDRFSAQLRLVYRERSDWLLYDSDRDFTAFSSTAWEPQLAVDFFLSAKQQFRMTAQWVGIKAFEADRWEIPLGDGSLIPDPDPVTDSRDFSIGRLVFQARYRWEIAPLSDLFIVYTRGSNVPSDPTQRFDDILSESWTDPLFDVFVIKLRYRLGS